MKKTKKNSYKDPFLESGCRCIVCDNFGTENKKAELPFVCPDCKGKKEADWAIREKKATDLRNYFMEKQRVLLIEYFQDAEQIIAQNEIIKQIKNERYLSEKRVES